jgi:hypothetical protein
MEPNAKGNLPPPLNLTTRNVAPGGQVDPIVVLFFYFIPTDVVFFAKFSDILRYFPGN